MQSLCQDDSFRGQVETTLGFSKSFRRRTIPSMLQQCLVDDREYHCDDNQTILRPFGYVLDRILDVEYANIMHSAEPAPKPSPGNSMLLKCFGGAAFRTITSFSRGVR